MIELPEEYFPSLTKYLEEVPFNHLFARAVTERRVSGRVYVDNIANPRSFYIVHRYGMSLLGGDINNREFNLAFKEHALNTSGERREHEWMQVFPYKWNEVLTALLGDRLITAKHNMSGNTRSIVELNTRVNFVFDKKSYLRIHHKIFNDDPQIKIIESTKEIYEQMKGSVVPSAFWNSSKDFIEKGVSFSLYFASVLAAASFSSFVAPGKLELGIETLPAFRGLGLAEKVCSALIDYCLEKKLEPIWACRLENTGSYRLAQKLGFSPILELPYYRLSN
jgi:hypothetical protein